MIPLPVIPRKLFAERVVSLRGDIRRLHYPSDLTPCALRETKLFQLRPIEPSLKKEKIRLTYVVSLYCRKNIP